MSSVSRIGLILVFGLWIQQGHGQTPTGSSTAKPVASEGEITARDVYVRSGPSMNHYEVCKVQVGERVSIVGEQGDWYEILPPEESFSLVSGEYVDTTDNKSGVVNGSNVRVRAGSSLNGNKYTVQVMLSKGDMVEILGTNPDGFLRIEPPVGATLWINRQFVRKPGDNTRASTSQPSTAPDTGVTETTPAAAALPTTPETSSSTSRANVKTKAAELPLPEHRRELDELDKAARAELTKPVMDREWTSIIERFQTVADAGPDELSRVYASHRIEQLRDLQEVTDTVRDLKNLDGATSEQRREFLVRRAALGHVSPSSTPKGMDAQGELRTSALYPPGSNPQRYRLIDPSSTPIRTIGYVEIPADSTIDIGTYIGRYVGVRASNTHLQTGGVNPIPVFVTSEIVPLQPPIGEAPRSPN